MTNIDITVSGLPPDPEEHNVLCPSNGGRYVGSNWRQIKMNTYVEFRLLRECTTTGITH